MEAYVDEHHDQPEPEVKDKPDDERLNRQQRRAKKKNAKLITPKQYNDDVSAGIRKLLAERADSIITETVANSLAVTISILHDKYGFGKSRIQKFMAEYNLLFETILEEYVDFEDLKAEALALGVRLETADE